MWKNWLNRTKDPGKPSCRAEPGEGQKSLQIVTSRIAVRNIILISPSLPWPPHLRISSLPGPTRISVSQPASGSNDSLMPDPEEHCELGLEGWAGPREKKSIETQGVREKGDQPLQGWDWVLRSKKLEHVAFMESAVRWIQENFASPSCWPAKDSPFPFYSTETRAFSPWCLRKRERGGGESARKMHRMPRNRLVESRCFIKDHSLPSD